MSTDPSQPTPPPSPSAPPATPAAAESAAPRPAIQVGRTSGEVRPRPTAAPLAPPPKKRREDRDAEKYAGTASEGGDEAQQVDQVDEEKPLVPKTDRGAPRGPGRA